jgi:hypothetical protein
VKQHLLKGFSTSEISPEAPEDAFCVPQNDGNGDDDGNYDGASDGDDTGTGLISTISAEILCRENNPHRNRKRESLTECITLK